MHARSLLHINYLGAHATGVRHLDHIDGILIVIYFILSIDFFIKKPTQQL